MGGDCHGGAADKALPELNAATEALKTLKKADVEEIKAYKTPPEAIQTVLGAEGGGRGLEGVLHPVAAGSTGWGMGGGQLHLGVAFELRCGQEKRYQDTPFRLAPGGVPAAPPRILKKA